MKDFDRGRWNKPFVLAPGATKKVLYDRFSSYGDKIADQYNLERWKLRQLARGLADHKHLLAQVAACPKDEKGRLDDLCWEAQKLAGSDAGAGMGTALHEFCARVDAGELALDDILDPWQADIRAYVNKLDEMGLEPVPGLIEIRLVHHKLKLAGTADNFYRRRSDGALVIADKKCGESIWSPPIGYMVQLAAYQQSELYDTEHDRTVPLEGVDFSTGYLVHIPPGRGECYFHSVDMDEARRLLELASIVRSYQKRKDLLRVADATSSIVVSGEGPSAVATSDGEVAPATLDRVTWVRDRIIALRELGATITWPADLVTPKAALAGAPVTDDDVERMVRVVADAERAVKAPFPAEDPTTPEPERVIPAPMSVVPTPPRPEEGRYLTDDERAELKAWVAEHCTDPEVATLVNRVAEEGGRELIVPAWPSVRRRTLAMALVRLANHGEEVLLAAVRPDTTIGAALAQMTVEQASVLLGVAEAIDVGRLALGYDETGPCLITTALVPA